MERKQLHIMAIGAHVGDMELTAGGVLAQHAAMGDKITIVNMTPGEKGNPPHLTVEQYAEQKIREAREFAEMLGGQSIVLDYKDGELPDTDEPRFRVADLIREHKPNILITHWKNSMHKDHSTTSRIVVDAQFYAGIKGFERENPAHFAGGPYFAENWEDPYDFKPYTYIDISKGYLLWVEALKKIWFVTNSTSFKYFEYYDALSKIRGCEARKSRAQAFAVDPLSMKQIKESF